MFTTMFDDDGENDDDKSIAIVLGSIQRVNVQYA